MLYDSTETAVSYFMRNSPGLRELSLKGSIMSEKGKKREEVSICGAERLRLVDLEELWGVKKVRVVSKNKRRIEVVGEREGMKIEINYR